MPRHLPAPWRRLPAELSVASCWTEHQEDELNITGESDHITPRCWRSCNKTAPSIPSQVRSLYGVYRHRAHWSLWYCRNCLQLCACYALHSLNECLHITRSYRFMEPFVITGLRSHYVHYYYYCYNMELFSLTSTLVDSSIFVLHCTFRGSKSKVRKREYYSSNVMVRICKLFWCQATRIIPKFSKLPTVCFSRLP